MVQQLWAPWRLDYVASDDASTRPGGCVLCNKPRTEPDERSYVVARGRLAYVVLNLYPYTNGHVMIVPYRHVADLAELTPDESAEAQSLLATATTTMRGAMGADGFNVGLNLGEAAGAGIASHLHWHLVPRWSGDTNFMPVLADVKVMPQHLSATWQVLREAWPLDLHPADKDDAP